MEKQIINTLLQQGMTIEEIKKYITEVPREMKISKRNIKITDDVLRERELKGKGCICSSRKGTKHHLFVKRK